MTLLAVAHECVIEGEDGKEFFQGPSPDEIELVTFAKSVGFELIKRSQSIMTVRVKRKLIEDDDPSGI